MSDIGDTAREAMGVFIIVHLTMICMLGILFYLIIKACVKREESKKQAVKFLKTN